MLLVTIKDKKATFAMVLIADSQLRERDVGFCDNPYPHFTPNSH